METHHYRTSRFVWLIVQSEGAVYAMRRDRMTQDFAVFVRQMPAGNHRWYAYFIDENGFRGPTKALRLEARMARGGYPTHTSKKEAEVKAAKMSIEAPEIPLNPDGKTELGIYARDFFIWEADEERPRCPRFGRLYGGGTKVSRSYLADARRYLIKYILPAAIAEMRMQDIRPRNIETFRDALPSRLSNRAKNVIARTLGTVLKEAKKDWIIERNPAEDVDALNETPKKRITFSQEQAQDILSELQRFYPEPVYLAHMLAAQTGMRLGEIQGLRWSDVDEEKGVLIVRHAWAPAEGLKMRTKGGDTRYFPLSELTLPPLGFGDTHIFCDPADHYRPMTAKVIREPLHKVLVKLKIEKPREQKTKDDSAFGLHTWRHSLGSWMATAGFHQETRLQTLGHKLPGGAMAERYSQDSQWMPPAEILRLWAS